MTIDNSRARTNALSASLAHHPVLDARFIPLTTLRALLPDLIVAVPIDVVCSLMGLSESTVWGKCDEDKRTYDPGFPQPKRYPDLKRTVWNLKEVQLYLAKLFGEDSVDREFQAANGASVKSGKGRTRKNQRGANGAL